MRDASSNGKTLLPLAMSLAMSLLMLMVVLTPYCLLVLMSLGSGYSFPNLLPNRIDFAPWKHFFADRDSMLIAVRNSAMMSLVVGTLSTAGGLWIGRAIRRLKSTGLLFVAYMPFIVSPVVIGVGLYDLMIRIDQAGTLIGVMLLQTVFALSFSSVFFCEMWSSRAERMELLVANLGGTQWDVWRYAIIPQIKGLILICFLQTAISAWLDYGIVSIIGAGTVPTMTTKLFSYLREASVNQAAQASIMLLVPAWIGFFVTAWAYRFRRDEKSTEVGSTT